MVGQNSFERSRLIGNGHGGVTSVTEVVVRYNSIMAKITDTEFGGDENAHLPGAKGRPISEEEMLRRMYATDPADETSGSDVVSKKEA